MARVSSLSVERQSCSDGTRLRLTGAISETFEPAALAHAMPQVVVVDLDGVTSITSSGVRQWLSAIGQIQGDYLGFVNCRPAMVAQFNMVTGFGGKGQLITFFCPFVCSECDEEFETLVDLRKQYEDIRALRAPSATCPKCQGPGEFDDVPRSFFAHAARLPPPTPPAIFDSLVDGTAFAAANALNVRKDVKGTLTVLHLSGVVDGTTRFKRVGAGLEGTVLLECEGLSGFTAEGIERMRSFLAMPGASFLLRRVPLELARGLTGAKGTLVSVVADVACSYCEHTAKAELLVGKANWLSPSGWCMGCRSLDLVLDGLLKSRVAELGLGELPAAVAKELQEREQEVEFGRYTLMRPIGTGGMAEVFLARQNAMGGFEKIVVLKRILPGHAQDHAAVTMFLREGRLAARVAHPNVVNTYDIGQVGDRHFISLEYVDGWTLTQLCGLVKLGGQTVPVPVALRVLVDVCSGLHAAHSVRDERGDVTPIIHRDVSPQNILIARDGRVKVSDFGIAKHLDGPQVTETGVVKGKLAYCAPEIFEDVPRWSPRTDVFATGVVLYQCLTQVNPFARETQTATLAAIAKGAVAPASSHRSEIPKELDDVISRALERDPEKRFSSADAFAQSLEEQLARLGGFSVASFAEWLKPFSRPTQTPAPAATPFAAPEDPTRRLGG